MSQALRASLDLFHADRAYIFQNLQSSDGRVYATQRFEVVSDGMGAYLEHPDLQMSAYQDLGFQRWIQVLEENGCISGNVSSFPEEEQPLLVDQGIQSLIVVPIPMNSGIWGFWGMDDCRSNREWPDLEESIVRNIGIAIGSYLFWNEETARLAVSRQVLLKAQEMGKIGSFSYQVDSGTWHFSEGLLDMLGPIPENHETFQELGLGLMDRENYRKVRKAFGALIRNPDQPKVEGRLKMNLDGEARYFSFLLESLASGRQVSAIHGFVQDITDQVETSIGIRQARRIKKLNAVLEKRLKQRTRELQKTNCELENFAYSVSHDLRTPLRHLIGYSKLLHEKAADQLSPNVLPYLDFLSHSAQKMNKLIEDLVEYSRLGRKDINPTMVDPECILPGLFDYFQRQVSDETIRFSSDIHRQVFADPFLLETLLTNLLSNAVKYRKKKMTAVIQVKTYAHQNGTMLEVVDNGIGFDMKYLDQVFGIFKRLHNEEEYQGSGIGLANVQRIMNRHSGSISAQSIPEEGATFRCFFPDQSSELQSLV